MATAKVPFELYVLDTSSKFSTPTPLSNLISTDTTGPLDIPNGLSIGSDNRLLVTPSGFELVSLETITDEGDNENTIVLTYKDNAGAEQTLEAEVINSNVLAVVNGPNFPTDPTDLLLQSTINGVASNTLSIAQLVADINVDTFNWDEESFTLTLTETSPDGGTTPGVVHEIDLSALVLSNVEGSITGDGSVAAPLSLVGDEELPGNHKFYGTDETGAKAFQNLVSTLPGNVVTIDPTDETGGVFVGAAVGEAVEVIPGNAVDVPLDYIGDPTVNLYAPAEFRLALDQVTGEPMVGPNGGNLVVALWELPPAVAPEFGTPSTTLTMTVGTLFSSSAPVVTGSPAPTFAIADGDTIAPGLTLNASTGAITGTPTTAGTFVFDVVATNSAGSDTFEVTAEVAA